MNKVEVLEQNHNKYCISAGCSNAYAPYLSVYLMSLVEHISDENFYDIVILESDISKENKYLLQSLVKKENVSLRFFDCSSYFYNKNLYIANSYFAKQCYYRLALGEVFKDYNKVAYTDIDLLINFDIYDLFKVDIKDCAMGAVEEYMWAIDDFKEENVKPNVKVKDYVKSVVGESGTYFNTGVVVVDVKKFNEHASFEHLLEVALTKKYMNQEQCVLNNVFLNKIYKLDSSYNFEIFYRIFESDKPHNVEFMNTIDDAKIWHWLTSLKVWFNPAYPKGYEWWAYARKSPFYEQILAKMMDYKIVPVDESIDDVKEMIEHVKFIIKTVKNSSKNVLKCLMYYVLTNITFGELKQKLIRKKRLYKEYNSLVKDIMK